MNALLESCLTFLAAYGVLYVLAYALTGGILLMILIYSWYDETSYKTKGSTSEGFSVLIMIVVVPMVLGLLPPEYRTLFYEGLPYMMLMSAVGGGIMFVQDRREKHSLKVDNKMEEEQ